jgi:hypothetical protein
MTTPQSHFVVASNAPFSHCPPLLSLAIRLLTLTPDLSISFILHINNEENSRQLISLAPLGVADRLKLYPVGELTPPKETTKTVIALAYKGGEAYAQILMVRGPLSLLILPAR